MSTNLSDDSTSLFTFKEPCLDSSKERMANHFVGRFPTAQLRPCSYTSTMLDYYNPHNIVS